MTDRYKYCAACGASAKFKKMCRNDRIRKSAL